MLYTSLRMYYDSSLSSLSSFSSFCLSLLFPDNNFVVDRVWEKAVSERTHWLKDWLTGLLMNRLQFCWVMGWQTLFRIMCVYHLPGINPASKGKKFLSMTDRHKYHVSFSMCFSLLFVAKICPSDKWTDIVIGLDTFPVYSEIVADAEFNNTSSCF